MAISGACVAAVNGDPQLYLGTADDKIQLAFAVQTLAEYAEIGKAVDFGDPASDKLPEKLLIFLAPNHSGAINVYLNYDDGTALSLGTINVASGGIVLPVVLPVTLPVGVLQTVTLDIRNANAQRKLGKSFQVQITSGYHPQILGYQLEAVLCPTRYKGNNLNEPAGYGQLPAQSTYGTLPAAFGA